MTSAEKEAVLGFEYEVANVGAVIAAASQVIIMGDDTGVKLSTSNAIACAEAALDAMVERLAKVELGLRDLRTAS